MNGFRRGAAFANSRSVSQVWMMRHRSGSAARLEKKVLDTADLPQITRQWVDDIRDAAAFIEGGVGARPIAEHRKPWAARLRAYADMLESYLPPR